MHTDVVFTLKLVLVLGFKNNDIIWKTASQWYAVGKRKRSSVSCPHRS